MTETLLQTPLYQSHLNHGGKVVPFAGWALPVQFKGVIDEHKAVREGCGIFDVSHMGEIIISGADSEKALQYLTCNDVTKLEDGAGQYSAILNDQGGVVDDIIIYRRSGSEFFLCVNASNSEKDYLWLKSKVNDLGNIDCRIVNVSSSFGQIAVQGPLSPKVMNDLIPGSNWSDLKYFSFTDSECDGIPVIVARTGYTGETGYEIFIPAEDTETIWEKFAAHKDVALCGLGARDTLRLEVCYPLHGHELGDDISALESGLGWIVKFNKGEFVGKSALAEEKAAGSPRKLAGLFVTEAGLIRHGDKIFSAAGEEIGYVTSGTKTPSVNQALGIALIKKDFTEEGTELSAEVRGRKLKCKVVKMPFWKAQKQI